MIRQPLRIVNLPTVLPESYTLREGEAFMWMESGILKYKKFGDTNANNIGCVTLKDTLGNIVTVNPTNTFRIISNDIKDSTITVLEDGTIELSVNMKVTSDYLIDLIQSINAGPKDVFPTLTDLQTAYATGTTGIYYVQANGHWYYWNTQSLSWADGGLYQSPLVMATTTGISETSTMTQKAITDELNAIKNDIAIIKTHIGL